MEEYKQVVDKFNQEYESYQNKPTKRRACTVRMLMDTISKLKVDAKKDIKNHADATCGRKPPSTEET